MKLVQYDNKKIRELKAYIEEVKPELTDPGLELEGKQDQR